MNNLFRGHYLVNYLYVIWIICLCYKKWENLKLEIGKVPNDFEYYTQISISTTLKEILNIFWKTKEILKITKNTVLWKKFYLKNACKYRKNKVLIPFCHQFQIVLHINSFFLLFFWLQFQKVVEKIAEISTTLFLIVR